MTLLQENKTVVKLAHENSNPNETWWNIRLLLIGLGAILIAAIVLPIKYYFFH